MVPHRPSDAVAPDVDGKVLGVSERGWGRRDYDAIGAIAPLSRHNAHERGPSADDGGGHRATGADRRSGSRGDIGVVTRTDSAAPCGISTLLFVSSRLLSLRVLDEGLVDDVG